MRLERLSEKIMGMSEQDWQRHTNPWSGWSRLITLPLLAFSIWSRVWIGPWFYLLLLLSLLWIWINPRLFKIPKNTENWMSKGVLGEKIWLQKKYICVPHSYKYLIRILNTFSALGMIPYIYGLVILNLYLVILGMVIIIISKLYFIHIMTKIYTHNKKT